MRIEKFVGLISIVTIIALGYVWQQSEIFRQAYSGQSKIVKMQDLLDKNTVLRYNIQKNASLIRIGNKISQDADFQMPDSFQLVRLSNLKGEFKVTRRIPKRENMLASLFGVKAQAEAKTINP